MKYRVTTYSPLRQLLLCVEYAEDDFNSAIAHALQLQESEGSVVVIVVEEGTLYLH